MSHFTRATLLAVLSTAAVTLGCRGDVDAAAEKRMQDAESRRLQQSDDGVVGRKVEPGLEQPGIGGSGVECNPETSLLGTCAGQEDDSNER